MKQSLSSWFKSAFLYSFHDQIILSVWALTVFVKTTSNSDFMESTTQSLFQLSSWNWKLSLPGSLLPSMGDWFLEETVGTAGKPFFMPLGGIFLRWAAESLPNNQKISWLMFYWKHSLPVSEKKKCQIFLWILAQTDLIQERFEVILTFKLDIKTVQKYLTSFYIYIPSSFSNILSGLVCHMSDPHCGLHQDHWPPASPLSLPSAPRLGLFFGQRPNVDWLDTCLSKLSAESPHRLLKLWIYLLHISQHHARYSGQEPAIHRGTMNSCFSPVT